MVSCGVVLCGMVSYDLDVVRSCKCVVLSGVVWCGMVWKVMLQNCMVFSLYCTIFITVTVFMNCE